MCGYGGLEVDLTMDSRVIAETVVNLTKKSYLFYLIYIKVIT